MSTTAEITERLAQVPTRKRRPTAAALFSQEEEFLQAQRERLEFLKGNTEPNKVPPPPPPPKQPPGAAGGNPGDDPRDDDDDLPSEKATEGDQKGAVPGNLPDPDPGTQGRWKRRNSLRH